MATKHGLERVSSPARGAPPELVVDLSNVCRNNIIDGSADAARWDRLLAVLDAWTRWEFGSERPVVRLVADDTLRRLLSPEDRRALKDAEADGYAEVLEYADPVILDLAEEHGCTVLSNDQFIGHRRERTWLDGNADRFVQILDANGAFALSLVQLSPRSGYSMSRAEEHDEMKARRIDLKKQRGTDLLEHVYRCDNKACLRRAFSPDASMPPKKASDGSAVCPGCGEPLTRIGSRVDTAILKLTSVNLDESVRLPVSSRTSVVIGRASSDLSLKTLLADADLPRISREHVTVSFDGRQVTIEDLDSTNGTFIERWSPAEKRRGEPVRVMPGRVERLGARDRAMLGEVLAIERSGRRYPFDLGAPVLASQPVPTPPTVAEAGGVT